MMLTFKLLTLLLVAWVEVGRHGGFCGA
jgi:hypothetical protein